ncbi:hypothetical protein Aph02nite_73750 [Actinoplanes philippinensis]|nr:hypothetical protein Aph02nite_73750 [Actinoplanes philippinensis]
MVPAGVVPSVASLIALISTLDACAAQRTSARRAGAIPVGVKFSRRLSLDVQNTLRNAVVSVPEPHSDVPKADFRMAVETESTGLDYWHEPLRTRGVNNC